MQVELWLIAVYISVAVAFQIFGWWLIITQSGKRLMKQLKDGHYDAHATAIIQKYVAPVAIGFLQNQVQNMIDGVVKRIQMTIASQKGVSARQTKRMEKNQAKEIMETISPLLGPQIAKLGIPIDNPLVAQLLAPQLAKIEAQGLEMLMKSKMIPGLEVENIPQDINSVSDVSKIDIDAALKEVSLLQRNTPEKESIPQMQEDS